LSTFPANAKVEEAILDETSKYVGGPNEVAFTLHGGDLRVEQLIEVLEVVALVFQLVLQDAQPQQGRRFMATLRWGGILDPRHLSTKFGQYD